jgi:hypothetical protein
LRDRQSDRDSSFLFFFASSFSSLEVLAFLVELEESAAVLEAREELQASNLYPLDFLCSSFASLSSNRSVA